MGSSCSSAAADVTAPDVAATAPLQELPPWAQSDSEGSAATGRLSRRNHHATLKVALSLTPRTFTPATDDDCANLRAERAHRVDWAVQGLMERRRAALMAQRHARARNARGAPADPQQLLAVPDTTTRGEGSRSASQVLDTWRGDGSTDAPFQLLSAPPALSPMPHQRLSMTRAFSDENLSASAAAS